MFTINQNNANITQQNIGNNNTNSQTMTNDKEVINSLSRCLDEVEICIRNIDITENNEVDKNETLSLIKEIKKDLTKQEPNKDRFDKLQQILQSIANSTVIFANAPTAIQTLINLLNQFK